MKIILGTLTLSTLTGCGQAGLPYVFSGNEVPPSVVNEPRDVERPAPGATENATWMRLGDVPAMPKDFTAAPLIAQSKLQMINDRAQAEQLKEAVDNPPPAAPAWSQ
ncbi:MAG: hypothetical protein M3N08_08755 [Pseudomonadota bacterium]|nr:hypothetical protein [Pseudomonadota bacterium]